MDKWYFGNIVYKKESYDDFLIADEETHQISNVESERVLLKQVEDDIFRKYDVINTAYREYEIKPTDMYVTSKLLDNIPFTELEDIHQMIMVPYGVSNLELVYDGVLDEMQTAHIGLYLRYQNISKIYKRDHSNNKTYCKK